MIRHLVGHRLSLLLTTLTLVAALAALSCRNEGAGVVVGQWAEAILSGDLETARSLYDPDAWPDGHQAFEREFRETIEAGAEVSYEFVTNLEPGRATVTIHTVTTAMYKTWVIRLRNIEGTWYIFSLDRYFK